MKRILSLLLVLGLILVGCGGSSDNKTEDNGKNEKEDTSEKENEDLGEPIELSGVITVGKDGYLVPGVYDIELLENKNEYGAYLNIKTKNGDRVFYDNLSSLQYAKESVEEYYNSEEFTSLSDDEQKEKEKDAEKYLDDYSDYIVKSIVLEEGYTVDTDEHLFMFTRVK